MPPKVAVVVVTAGRRPTAARRLIVLRVLLACILPINVLAAAGIEVLKVEEGHLGYGEWHGGERVYRLWFDTEHRLHWDDHPLQDTKATCPTAPSNQVDLRAMGPRREVLLGYPRVDQVLCPDGRFLVQGLDAEGQPRWQRELGKRQIIGRSEQGLVATDLEVWAPDTGEIVVPSVSGIFRPDGTAIPRYSFHAAALYRLAFGDFILFQPEPHRFGESGLYRLAPASGTRELLLADQGCGPLGLGKTMVVDMRSDSPGRHIFLLHRCSLRGHPTRDALAVLDTATRTILFEDRYDPEQQVVAMALAGNGNLGIALHVPRRQQVRLLRYHLSGRCPR